MDVVAVLQKELEETRALLKEANARHERQLKEALADANDRHERQLKEVNDRHERQLKEVNVQLKDANDRFADFSKFALKTATDAFTRSTPVLKRTRNALEESTTVAYGCRARLTTRHNTAMIDFVKGSPRHIRKQVVDAIEPRILRSVNNIMSISETKTVASPEVADKLAKGVIKHTKSAWKENGRTFVKKGVRVSFRRMALFISADEKSRWFAKAVSFLAETVAVVIRSTDPYTSIVDDMCDGLGDIELTLAENEHQIQKRLVEQI